MDGLHSVCVCLRAEQTDTWTPGGDRRAYQEPHSFHVAPFGADSSVKVADWPPRPPARPSADRPAVPFRHLPLSTCCLLHHPCNYSPPLFPSPTTCTSSSPSSSFPSWPSSLFLPSHGPLATWRRFSRQSLLQIRRERGREADGGGGWGAEPSQAQIAVMELHQTSYSCRNKERSARRQEQGFAQN